MAAVLRFLGAGHPGGRPRGGGSQPAPRGEFSAVTSPLLQDHVTVNEDRSTGLEPRLPARDAASDQEECVGHSGLTAARGEAGKGFRGAWVPSVGPVAPAP